MGAFVIRLTSALGVALLAAATPAAALEQGVTQDGWPFAAGGFGVEEREALERMRAGFRLRATMAARGSGAYLSGVRARITDASGRLVFDREVAGPLLLIDLPPGRYTVRAILRGETLEQRTALGVTDRRELYFYFPVAADVLPADAPEHR